MNTSSTTKQPRHEPHAHVLMRRVRTVSRWLLIIALLATVSLFLLMPAAAYLAAIPIPVLFVVYLLAGQWERQSRSTAAPSGGR